MTAVIETEGLGMRYRKLWALADCTLSIPAGHVVGLVGPNGAGKTTLLNLATGMLAPTTGAIEVLGSRPAAGPAQLARVGYLAQDAPVYAGLSVADHLKLGARLNPGWDAEQARDRAGRLDLNLRQKAGTLSGGQRAQLALTLATAKRPELLILDEPVASLDPLARREFLQDLMETVAEQQVSVGLSSHLISDLERVCDYVIVLVDSRVKAVGLGGSASIFSEGRFGPFVFPTHGITPLGYAAFGLALGVTAGLLIRRALPAMAVTLAIFAVVQFATPLWVRPHLVPSSHTIATIEAAGANVTSITTIEAAGANGTAAGHSTIAFSVTAVPGQPGAWIFSSATVNAAGQPVSGVPAACQSAIPHVLGPGGSPALDSCLAGHGIRVAESYLPVSRYWPLQFAETGLFLVLALALAWYCFWRLNRRLS